MIDSKAKLFFAALTHEKLPLPEPEFYFARPRKWRFDYAWPDQRLALEVQGGIWTGGRHSRGAALLKEWEKLNTAASKGWRLLYCQPADLTSLETMKAIRESLTLTIKPEPDVLETLRNQGPAGNSLADIFTIKPE